ncbi:hypothetical protein [Xanthovirga aplysinae]|uniref:hypothetical protein n=1 Tax=Xanthovirga aplysinae TaxID=2529853 RepID=UPI0012BC5E7C|nr:hypothetical protein [Xanthovirga aplysinae]MTI33610.1 hypothetical protein [Xanthovirga aplysinae]
MKNCKIIVLSFLLLGVIFSQATAQEQQDKQEEVSKYEIGFDAAPVLFTSNSESLFMPGLMFRLHNNGTAYRLRLNVGRSTYNRNSSSDFEVNPPEEDSYKETSSSYLLRLGKEWRKQLKSNALYFGSDISYSYSNINSVDTDGVGSSEEALLRGNGIGLMPFIGADFLLTNKLHLSVEASADISYNKATYERISFNEFGDEVSEYKDERGTFNTKILSNYALVLSYRF